MCRSFKKVAGWTDHKSPYSKIEKRFANKKVRKSKNIPNGRSYKKVYESWNICDFKFLYFSKNEVLRCIKKNGINKFFKYYMK